MEENIFVQAKLMEASESVRQFLVEIGRKGGYGGRGVKKPRGVKPLNKRWGRPPGSSDREPRRKGVKLPLGASLSPAVSPPCQDEPPSIIIDPRAIERLLEEGKTVKEAEREIMARMRGEK